MSAGSQFTEAHLADGTTIRFRGDLTPEQLQQKVAAYRSGKASKVKTAKQPQPDDTGIVDPSDPNQGMTTEQFAKTHFAPVTAEHERASKLQGMLYQPNIDAPLISGRDLFNYLSAATLQSKPGADAYGDLQKYATGIGMPEETGAIKPGSPYAGRRFEDVTPLQEQEGLKRGAAHAVTDTADVAGAFTKPSSIALTAAGPLGKAIPAISPAMKAAQIAGGTMMGTEGAVNVGKSILDSEGDTADRTQQALMGLSQMFGGAAGAAEPLKPTADIFFKSGLNESAHRMLSDAATKTKQLVGQGGTVHQNVSNHFSQLLDDIAAADYANGKKIDTSSLWETVSKYADEYAAGKTTPNFNAIADAIQKRPVEMTFKELHDLKKEVGSRWDKTQAGTRDEAAAGQALNDINSKLSSRASELGRSKQYDAMNTIWRTLKEYEGNGSLATLMNTVVDPVAPGAVSEGGKKFFDVLRDPANQPKLKEINKSLEPYGMPADYFRDLAKSHAPLHNMVAGSASGGGMFGRTKAAMRAIKENPAVGIPAVAAGTTLGGVVGGPIGGTLGAIGALKGVERLSAANAMRKLGGIPADVNPMAEASQVKPVGGNQPPPAPVAQQRPMSPKPAPVPTVNEDAVKSAAQSLGYNSKTARSMAQEAIQKFPNDEKAAIDYVAGKRTPSVSGGKAVQIEDIAEEARRGGGSAPVAPDTSQTYVRPTKKGKSIADQIQAAKSGDVMQRVEQHKMAKKDIGEDVKKAKGKK